MAEKLIVGIDAGGTSIRVAWRGASVGEVVVPAASDGGPEPILTALASLNTATAICAGVTKITRNGIEERWRTALQHVLPSATVQVVPDYQIAFRGAVASGVGVMTLAGTGSVVYGENDSGKAVRVGGRGWEYGDEGSGAHLTSDLLRRTLRALDGLYPRTTLTDAVCQFLGESDDTALVAEAARQRAQADGRGFLVPMVLAQAQAGEPEAIGLFVGAAGWLARYTRAAVEQLGLVESSTIRVATVGGLWEAGNILRTPFVEVLERWIPGVVVAPADHGPLEGALALAEATTYNATVF